MIAKPLGQWATVFQAEIKAITACVEGLLGRRTRNTRIHILSDSQAALRALDAQVHESWVVWECRDALMQLAMRNEVVLQWVPGHEGIDGNEKADDLAKKGTEMCLVGPDPCCGVSYSCSKGLVRGWLARWKDRLWWTTPGLRQSKLFVNPYAKESGRLLLLAKGELRILSGMLTGHGPLRKHLSRMGIGPGADCRFCLEDEETAEHLWIDCPAISTQRRQNLGRGWPSPQEIRELDPSIRLLGFCKSLRLEE